MIIFFKFFFYKNQLNKEEEGEAIFRRILHQIMNITDQNQLFINDLIESNKQKKKTKYLNNKIFLKVSLKRRLKSILSDIFLRCLTSTQSNLIKSLIGYRKESFILFFFFLNLFIFL